jgi:predicted TIM-barrel fold metal-dependent hydrolase
MASVEKSAVTEREIGKIIQPHPIHPKGKELEVIDSDFHFQPDWDDLRKYMKEPFKSKFLRYPQVASEYAPDQAIGLQGTGQNVQGQAKTAADVLRVLDNNYTDTVILSPGFQRPQSMFNEPMITAVASAYNDYLVHEVLPVSDRIKGLIMINQRDPVAGAAEIRRLAHHPGFVGVYSEFGGTYEPIGSAKHDPIYDALAEFDLPISIHIGTFWQQWSPLSIGSRTWVELLGVSSAGTCMAFMASMIMQGLFDKYPKQKVLVQEGGYWWLPDLIYRMDELYLDHPGDIQFVERKLESGEKYLKKLPSEYILEHFRFATQPMCKPKNNKHFAYLLELCHAEQLFLYSSDWPHATYDPLNWVVETDFISEEMQKKILSGNAREFYKRL